MRNFINQIPSWDLLVLFLLVYFIVNLFLARRFTLDSEVRMHPLDRIMGFTIFFFAGAPIILFNACKIPK